MPDRYNRATLRNFFRVGSLPTQEHFYALVDSALNMVDEGFRKSPEHGFEVSALGSRNALLSFYTQMAPDAVQWSISYGPQVHDGGRSLVFIAPETSETRPVMTLDPLGRVGIGRDRPQHALDVAGVVRAGGRMGSLEPASVEGEPAPRGKAAKQDARASERSPVAADGEWHYITDWLRGCQAFEVVAGTGSTGSGRYALLHAIALNTFNPKRSWRDLFWPRKRIDAREAYFSSRCDRLELAWEGTSGKGARYRLKIRSRCPYRGDVQIRYHITQLWFDDMDQGEGEEGR